MDDTAKLKEFARWVLIRVAWDKELDRHTIMNVAIEIGLLKENQSIIVNGVPGGEVNAGVPKWFEMTEILKS